MQNINGQELCFGLLDQSTEQTICNIHTNIIMRQTNHYALKPSGRIRTVITQYLRISHSCIAVITQIDRSHTAVGKVRYL
jgi:hypothetical protein